MKKLLFVFSIILLSLTNHLFGQGFYSMARYVDSVYANDNSEDGPKANVTRARLRWEGQFNSAGKFTTAAQNYYNFTQNLTNSRIANGSCQNFDPTWKEIGPTMKANNSNGLNGAGVINRLTFHPNYDGVNNQTIFGMSYYGGIWKTTDDGENWIRLNTDIQIPFSSFGVLVIDPTNPNRMYVTTGISDAYNNNNFPYYTIGIYATDDGGINWQAINNSLPISLFSGASIFNLAIDPTNSNNLIFTSSEGVFVSTNATSALGSITWSKDANFPVLTGNNTQIVGLTYNTYNSGDPNPAQWFVSAQQIYSCTNPFSTTHTWNLTTGSGSGLDLTAGTFPSTSDPITLIKVINSPFFTNDIYGMIYTAANKVAFVKKITTGWQITDYVSYPSFGGGVHADKINFVKSPNANDFFMGSTHFGYYNSSNNNLLTQYGYGLGGENHADIHGLYIHPTKPQKLWALSDGGVAINNLPATYIPNLTSFVYKNVGIQSQLLYSVDDSEQDKDYLLAPLQDNGAQFIGGAASGEWKIAKSSVVIGDGYNAEILEGNPHDAIVHGYGNLYYNFDYSTYSPNTLPVAPMGNATFKSQYFPNPQNPSEKIFIGDNNWQVTTGGGTVWHTPGMYSIPSINLLYNFTTYPYSDKGLFIKATYQNYYGTPAPAYMITSASHITSIPIPSLIFKSINGFNFQYSYTESFFTNVNQITNALYDQAKLDGAITINNLPSISGISCKPENGNVLWVSSNGLLPHFKIYKSIDGGATWENADDNYVFANLIVYDVLVVEGSNNIVFASTNDGVYYTDNSMLDHWCRYGATPSVQTLSMKVNYCKNKLIVGTYGRGAFEVDLPPQNVQSTDITVNTTWTTPQYFPKTSLTVKTGKTLTISNTSVFFGPNSRLIVEKGAKLIVNNSTLTSASDCNGYLWSGIEVQGDVNFRQNIVSGYDANHGIAVLQNNAIVQNAHYAIQNNVGVNGEIDWSKLGGGIVKCTNTQFINCQKGANFMPYTNHNLLGNSINDLSYFITCQFKTDASTASHNFMPEAHASFWNTKGVNLVGNTFKNMTPNAYAISARGNGIVSYDASYDVVRACNVLDATTGACAGVQNVFENLYYGIDASASLPSASVRIDGNVFTNNHRGAVLHAVEFGQVVNNTMSIGEQIITTYPPSTAVSINAPCGIYLDACDAYVVQNNVMTNAVGTTNTLDYGIVASYSNQNPNELRHNSFNNIAIGIQAQDNNDGLQLKCNQFANGSINAADVKILGQFTQGSIAQQQGACFTGDPTKLAGNEFSQTCAAGALDLAGNNVAYQVTYNTRTTPNVELPQLGCFNTTYYNVNLCTGSSVGAVCPPTNFTPSVLKIAIKNSKQDIKSLTQLLADGDAPVLYNVLASGTDAQIRNKLLNKSPYLSDAVLVLLLTHNPQLSETTLKDILLTNSPLSINVYQTFFKLKVSSTTADAIKQAQIGVSQRTYTERALAYEKSQLVINYNNQLSYILNNRDNEARFDSLLANIDFTVNPKSRALYAGVLIDQQKYPQAQIQLDNLQPSYPQLTDYLQQLMQLRQLTNQIQGYAGNLKLNMDNLKANRPSDLAVKAQALYNSLFKKTFGEVIYITPAQQASAARQAQIEKENSKQNDVVKVFPNPATNELYFIFDMEDATDVNIQLYDISGRLLKAQTLQTTNEVQKIDLQDLTDGIYIYQVISNGKLIKTSKVVIIK